MTDKQIIIDGVDVSECEYVHLLPDRYCGMNYACTCNLGNCRENPNCYYKQLKHKEQECKNNKIAYKNEIDIINQECLNLQQQLNEALDELDQLKAENEELKEKLKISCIKSCQDCEDCIDCIDEIPCKTIRDLDYALLVTIDERDKYKQALDEIEQVFKNGAYDKDNMPLYEDVAILDIINKAKEEE